MKTHEYLTLLKFSGKIKTLMISCNVKIAFFTLIERLILKILSQDLSLIEPNIHPVQKN